MSALMNMCLEYRNMVFLHLAINMEDWGIKRDLVKRKNIAEFFLFYNDTEQIPNHFN